MLLERNAAALSSALLLARSRLGDDAGESTPPYCAVPSTRDKNVDWRTSMRKWIVMVSFSSPPEQSERFSWL